MTGTDSSVAEAVSKFMDKAIFNNDKTDYGLPSLFLGEEMGLVDSINKHYPKLWSLYKKLKAQDWDELEFDLSTCNNDFKTCSKNIYDMMLLTLAWQWEADSIASKTLYAIGAPFITSTELDCLWIEITRNEKVHALTYSEIFRNSFDDPETIIPMVQQMQEAVQRSEIVTSIFSEAYIVSHNLALGLISRESQQAYEAVFMFVVAMYFLEKMQFMASFAVTFAIADSGVFVPAGKAIQKIAQDEIEIHVETHKATLDYELKTERGINTFNHLKGRIKDLYISIQETEERWIKFLFSNGRELAGMDESLLQQWRLYCGKEPAAFFGFSDVYQFPDKNPLGFMKEWLNIDKIQVSPQEENPGGYLLGAISRDLGDKKLDYEDL